MNVSSALVLVVIMVAGNPCKETMMGNRNWHLHVGLDGGGGRGVFTQQIGVRADEGFADFRNRINSLSGASTGALGAAGIARGMTFADGKQLYLDHGPLIFKDSFIDNVRDLGIMLGAQYSIENLRLALEKVFGRTSLEDLVKPMIAPTLATDRRVALNGVGGGKCRMMAPKILSSWPDAGEDLKILLSEALTWVAAAPTYFELVYGTLDGRPTYFADGGLFANNPTLCGVIEALKQGVDGRDLAVLSIGTGMNPHFVSPVDERGDDEDLDAGVAWWMQGGRLLKAIMEPAQHLVHMQTKALVESMGGTYMRVNAILPHEWALDSVKVMPDLIACADAVDLRPMFAWLKRIMDDKDFDSPTPTEGSA